MCKHMHVQVQSTALLDLVRPFYHFLVFWGNDTTIFLIIFIYLNYLPPSLPSSFQLGHVKPVVGLWLFVCFVFVLQATNYWLLLQKL